MPQIFISYRRADSAAIVGRINDVLAKAFGQANVFRDVDIIPLAADFRTEIENHIISADYFFVILGPKWLTLKDDSGNRRLDDPADFVRLEVEMGLRHKSDKVLPILVDNASMPAADDLPFAIRDLAFKNAAMVRNDPDFVRDMERLIRAIDSPLPPPPPKRRWLLVVGIIVLTIIASLILSSGIGGQSPTNTPEPATAAVLVITKRAGETLTAIAPTQTNTPDMTKTIDALVTQYFITQAAYAKETIAAYTKTPTLTYTPSASPTATNDLNGTATQDALTLIAVQQTNVAQMTLDAENTLTAQQATAIQATLHAQATANVPTNTSQPTLTPSSVPTATSTHTPTFTATLTPTTSPTSTLTATATIDLTGTANALATQSQATALAATNAIQVAQATLNAQSAKETAIQAALNAQATASVPTNTSQPTLTPTPIPTATLTHTLTFTPTLTPISSPTSTSTATATIDLTGTTNINATQTIIAAQNVLSAQPNLVAYVAANAPINVRNRPNGTISSSLPPHMSVAILDKSKDGSWLSIELPDGQAGWISASLVRVTESAVPADLVPITPDNVGQLEELTQLASTLATEVTFSPDGRLLATYSWDPVINIYDVRTKILIATLTKHTKGLAKVAFSPKGDEMASASGDGSVKIWNTQTWGVRIDFRNHKDSLTGMAYSPDGAYIASIDMSGVLIIWDVQTGQQMHVIQDHTFQANQPNAVIFSPDGSKIATASGGYVRLWDIATGEQLWERYIGGNLQIDFSSNGSTLLIATGGPLEFIAINVETSHPIFRSRSTGDVPFASDVNPAGTLMAAATYSGLFSIVDAENGKNLFNNALTYQLHPGAGLAFSPNGRLLVTTDRNKAIYLWGVHGK